MKAPVEIPPKKKQKNGEGSPKASSPMEVPHEMKQKIGEGSTDVEELGSTSGDQQMDLFSCLVCTLKAQWDNLDNHSEEYCEVCQPFTRSLPELTSSRISSAHASSVSFSDAILRQANNKREVACCRAIYGYKSSEGQGMFAIVKVGPSESRLSQIGEGTQLLRMADILFSKGGLVPIKLLPFILDPPVEAKLVENEGNWSSLPVLPLLMIMDKLDIFDNKRLSAVCKDWQSAATMQYPKRRYSVGDGVPWIWYAKYGRESTSREFIRCLGSSTRKFTVDMPEFAKSLVISSRGGWILLQHRNLDHPELTCSWFLVNPFTRDSIELPKREVHNKASCLGSFTLRDSDGYPERVVLIQPKPNFQASVLTACPGDTVWRISHDYTGLKMNHLDPCSVTLVLIRDTAYCLDPRSVITSFNVANNLMKVLPRTRRGGFIAEHKGKLIYVIVKKYESLVLVLRYDEASSSWKTMRPSAVMGTSWYLSGRQNIIAGKGKGLKFYSHIPKFDSIHTLRVLYHYVRVTDLLTGKERTIRIPSPGNEGQCWVAIG